MMVPSNQQDISVKKKYLQVHANTYIRADMRRTTIKSCPTRVYNGTLDLITIMTLIKKK